jgi:hypothetical protein
MTRPLSVLISALQILWLMIVFIAVGLPSKVQAEEVNQFHVRVEPQRIEFRLKFSLQTLQKFLVLDSDHNGFLTRQEVANQEVALRDYLSRHVLITLNGRETNLGFPKPMKHHGSDDQSGKGVPLAEFDQRWVELTFMKSAQPFIADVGIRLDLFKTASDLDRIDVKIEQGESSKIITLSRSEPEHRWQTGFSADSIPEPVASISNETPSSLDPSTKFSSSMIVFGLVAMAITWLLLRRVHQISRGSFYIGPRE